MPRLAVTFGLGGLVRSCFGVQPPGEHRSHLVAVIVKLVSRPGDVAVGADQHGLYACPFGAFVGEPSDGHVESVARIGRSQLQLAARQIEEHEAGGVQQPKHALHRCAPELQIGYALTGEPMFASALGRVRDCES